MLVLQSYREEHVPEWIQACLKSVQSWAEVAGYDYHCAGDVELLATLTESVRKKLTGRWPMLADIGRLKLMQKALTEGHERVVWMDADVYLFAPEKMRFPEVLENGYAFGREVWVEASGKVRHGVHNAFCLFEQGNPFLDYYIHACERIVAQHSGQHLAPQLLGPKFLKMQYNLLKFPLMDSVAMLSPVVVAELVHEPAKLWEIQREELWDSVGAVNLCHSLLDDALGEKALRRLQSLEKQG